MSISHRAPDTAQPCRGKSPNLQGFTKQFFRSQQGDDQVFLGMGKGEDPEAIWEEYHCLRWGCSWQGPCCREGRQAPGSKAVSEHWGLLPHLLTNTTSRRAGFMCVVKNSETNWADASEKIKSQSAAHLKLSVTPIQLQKHKTQGWYFTHLGIIKCSSRSC